MVTSSFIYDVFISYSHKDEGWVRGVLLPTLEKNNIKTIIDFRDFKPGAPSITEMERAVKESRKTVLVLTNSYLSSAWSEFEVILASTLDPAGRNRQIIPILIEKANLPTRISYLTYVDFTENGTEKLSWEKLIRSVKSSQEVNPYTSIQIPKQEQTQRKNKNSGLPSNLNKQLRDFLMDCDELASNARLRALFSTKELLPFRNSVSEAGTLSERVDLLVDFIVRRNLTNGQSLLIVFMDVLKTRIPETDNRYNEIKNLIKKLNQEIPQGLSAKEEEILRSDVKSGEIVIWVNRDFQKFDNEQLNNFIDNLARLLDISKSDIKVLKVVQGSVLLTLEMPEAAAKKLIAMYLNKESVLGKLDINRVEIEKMTEVSKLNNPIEHEVVFVNDSYAGIHEVMKRLDALENNIGTKLEDLKLGQAFIYQKIKPIDLEYLKKIFDEVHVGRIEQGELQRTLDAIRRVIKFIIDKGVKVSDPSVIKLLENIYQSVNSGLTFDQQFELTLPVIPFLLDYKMKVEAGVDLQAIWQELIARFESPRDS